MVSVILGILYQFGFIWCYKRGVSHNDLQLGRAWVGQLCGQDLVSVDATLRCTSISDLDAGAVTSLATVLHQLAQLAVAASPRLQNKTFR